MRNPSWEEERALHARVLRKEEDPTASTEVFRIYMELLPPRLCRDGRCDRSTAEETVSEIVWAYLSKPEHYDPFRRPLKLYLLMVARRRLVDRYRSENKRREREKKYATDVELPARPPNQEMEDLVEARRIWNRLKGRKLKNLQEQNVLRLILSGERSTGVLAEAMGLASLPKDEMQREVKKCRDRLLKMLERFGKEEDPDDES